MTGPLRLPRWNDVLLEIYKSQERDSYCEKLNRAVKGSRTHLREIVKSLAKSELVEILPDKKIKKLALTEKGRRVSLCIQQMKSDLRKL